MERLLGGRERRPGSPVPIERLLATARNDCVPVVREQYPPVGDALRWLGRRAPARMTGTGPTVFARFDTHEHAREVANDVPEPWRGVVTRGA